MTSLPANKPPTVVERIASGKAEKPAHKPHPYARRIKNYARIWRNHAGGELPPIPASILSGIKRSHFWRRFTKAITITLIAGGVGVAAAGGPLLLAGGAAFIGGMIALPWYGEVMNSREYSQNFETLMRQEFKQNDRLCQAIREYDTRHNPLFWEKSARTHSLNRLAARHLTTTATISLAMAVGGYADVKTGLGPVGQITDSTPAQSPYGPVHGDKGRTR